MDPLLRRCSGLDRCQISLYGILVLFLVLPQIYCAISAPPLTFRTEKFDRKWGLSDADSNISAELSLSYPVFSGLSSDLVDSITSTVNKYLFRPMTGRERTENADSLWITFRSSYEKICREFPDYRTAWKISREILVYGLHTGFVCLKFTSTEFTGGAHPNSSIFFEIRSLQNGRVMKLPDFVKPDKSKEFRYRIEEKFRKIRGLTSITDFSDAGFQFPDNNFYVPENFGINDSVMTFRFNSYDIGPYVLGPTDINLPLKDLEDLLK
jgi:hypothetical protein